MGKREDRKELLEARHFWLGVCLLQRVSLLLDPRQSILLVSLVHIHLDPRFLISDALFHRGIKFSLFVLGERLFERIYELYASVERHIENQIGLNDRQIAHGALSIPIEGFNDVHDAFVTKGMATPRR